MKNLLSFLVENPNIRFIFSNGVCRIIRIENSQALQVKSIIEKEKLFLNLNGNITSVDIYKINPNPKAIAQPVTIKKEK